MEFYHNSLPLSFQAIHFSDLLQLLTRKQGTLLSVREGVGISTVVKVQPFPDLGSSQIQESGSQNCCSLPYLAFSVQRLHPDLKTHHWNPERRQYSKESLPYYTDFVTLFSNLDLTHKIQKTRITPHCRDFPNKSTSGCWTEFFCVVRILCANSGQLFQTQMSRKTTTRKPECWWLNSSQCNPGEDSSALGNERNRGAHTQKEEQAVSSTWVWCADKEKAFLYYSFKKLVEKKKNGKWLLLIRPLKFRCFPPKGEWLLHLNYIKIVRKEKAEMFYFAFNWLF